MNHSLSILLIALFASVLGSTQAAPGDEVTASVKKLADQPNYSWTITTEVPADSRFRPGPANGRTEKGGAMYLAMTFGEGVMEIARQGEKAAVTQRDGGWVSAAEMESDEGRGRFMAAMARNVQTPAEQMTELLPDIKDWKAEAGAVTGQLTEEGAKALLTFGRRRGQTAGPEIQGAKGSITVWIKDDLILKYQYKVQGTMSFNGNDRTVDRTTTVEIKDVGSTELKLPEAAKKKLS